MTYDVIQAISEHVSRENPLPLYAQVSGYLRDKISSGELRPGDAIPSQHDLGLLCSVSQITVRRAISELVGEGMLVCVPGSGTYVSDAPNILAETLITEGEPAEAALGLNVGEVFSRVNVVGLSHVRGLADGIRDALDDPPFIHYYELPFSAPNAPELAERVPLHSLDGLLLHSPCNLELIMRCRRERKPYVLMYNDISDGFSHCVSVDYVSGMLDCVGHLLSRSRRKIALVATAPERYSSGRLVHGFDIALKFHGLPPAPPEWVLREDYGEGPGHEATLRLLNGSERPDAIIYGLDVQAKGGLIAARELGIAVPEELALIGHGNELRPKEALVELTTVDPHLGTLGRLAMITLKRLIDGESDLPFYQVVTPELVVRESTGIVARA